MLNRLQQKKCRSIRIISQNKMFIAQKSIFSQKKSESRKYRVFVDRN